MVFGGKKLEIKVCKLCYQKLFKIISSPISLLCAAGTFGVFFFFNITADISWNTLCNTSYANQIFCDLLHTGSNLGNVPTLLWKWMLTLMIYVTSYTNGWPEKFPSHEVYIGFVACMSSLKVMFLQTQHLFLMTLEVTLK